MPIEESSLPASILLLAMLQGVAEFLPISSSGHLVIARLAMGVHEAGLGLDVALHVGTLFAVLIVYRRDVLRLFTELAHGRPRLFLWLLLATLPLAVVGLALKDVMERAFESSRVAGIGMLVTALVLVGGEILRRRHAARAKELGLERETPGMDDAVPRWRDALVMGTAQLFAICPGISRSGITISAGILVGMRSAQAARYGFLMSLPAISGAAIVSLPGAVEEGFGGLSVGLVLGAVGLAALVGWASLRVLLLTLARGSFRWFAAYCAVLGVAVLAFL